MKTYVALDPGKMTGIARAHVSHIIKHDAFELPEDVAVDWMWDNLYNVTVICESIVISIATAKKSQDVQSSIRQIGVADHLCRRRGLPFALQPPSDKAFGTDELLRALAWWTVGSDHARDASRHLAKFMAEDDPEFRQLAVEIV